MSAGRTAHLAIAEILSTHHKVEREHGRRPALLYLKLIKAAMDETVSEQEALSLGRALVRNGAWEPVAERLGEHIK